MFFSLAKSVRPCKTDLGIVAPVGLLGLFIIIILVLSLTRLFSSSKSGMNFFPFCNFHSETSAPRLWGTEYNC